MGTGDRRTTKRLVVGNGQGDVDVHPEAVPAAERMVGLDEVLAANAYDPIPTMYSLVLTQEEHDEVHRLAEDMPRVDPWRLSPHILSQIRAVIWSLPLRIARAVVEFGRSSNKEGVLLLRNIPIDEALPDTPPDGRPAGGKQTFISEVSLLLHMLMLGDPISYQDEKGGALIQDISPVAGQEYSQENSGSVEFEFHTENGFHPYRPDHLGLLCLRGDHEGVAGTTTASIRRVIHRLPNSAIRLLYEPNFRVGTAASFAEANANATWWMTTPVLSGSFFSPCLCLDFHKMEALTREAAWALDSLKAELLRARIGIVLAPGDLLLVDNRVAVHGRTSFQPRHDGCDRWLQRMFTVVDPRRTSDWRGAEMQACAPLFVQSGDSLGRSEDEQ